MKLPVVAVVLAGAEASTWSAERLLLPVCGVPVLARVCNALVAADTRDVLLLGGTSFRTAAEAVGIPFVLCESDGTSPDLAARLGNRSVLVLCADLALLTPATVRAFLTAAGSGATPRLLEASGVMAAFHGSEDARAAIRAGSRRDDCRGLVADGGTWRAPDPDDAMRLSTPAAYSTVERTARLRRLARLGEDGVLVMDVERTAVDDTASVGPGTILWPGTYVKGRSLLGVGCRIGPDVWIEDSRVEDGAIVRYSVLEGAAVGPSARIGPFAHLRQGAQIGSRARVGNFVEVKASRIGEDSKVGHLSYLGDANVGDRVNVGAGTITCNYDGSAKHRTVIEDGAFIGSHAALVAPVTIGRGAIVGAGSTITEDVPPGHLALGRARQVIKERKPTASQEER
ncbi:MAG: NTP transferase domain-containing protein [Candidatus Bipolaricaulota bacterium]